MGIPIFEGDPSLESETVIRVNKRGKILKEGEIDSEESKYLEGTENSKEFTEQTEANIDISNTEHKDCSGDNIDEMKDLVASPDVAIKDGKAESPMIDTKDDSNDEIDEDDLEIKLTSMSIPQSPTIAGYFPCPEVRFLVTGCSMYPGSLTETEFPWADSKKGCKSRDQRLRLRMMYENEEAIELPDSRESEFFLGDFFSDSDVSLGKVEVFKKSQSDQSNQSNQSEQSEQTSVEESQESESEVSEPEPQGNSALIFDDFDNLDFSSSGRPRRKVS